VSDCRRATYIRRYRCGPAAAGRRLGLAQEASKGSSSVHQERSDPLPWSFRWKPRPNGKNRNEPPARRGFRHDALLPTKGVRDPEGLDEKREREEESRGEGRCEGKRPRKEG
jgi:hypothetical protein